MALSWAFVPAVLQHLGAWMSALERVCLKAAFALNRRVLTTAFFAILEHKFPALDLTFRLVALSLELLMARVGGAVEENLCALLISTFWFILVRRFPGGRILLLCNY